VWKQRGPGVGGERWRPRSEARGRHPRRAGGQGQHRRSRLTASGPPSASRAGACATAPRSSRGGARWRVC